MRVTRKILTPATANLFFLINLIEFLKWSLHLKTTQIPFFFVEKQRVLPFIFRREKNDEKYFEEKKNLASRK